MLGKRFRRTTSMSQLGPAHPVVATSEEMQGVQSPDTASSGPHHHKAARPLIIQGKKLGYSAHEGDASMAGGFDVSSRDQNVGGPRIDVLCGGGYASTGVNVVDPSTPAISDTIFAVSPLLKSHGGNPTVQVQFPPSAGLWTHHNVGGDPYVGHYSTRFGKLEHAAEPIISPVDFLDACFFCKRRLRHERDIFIYRGDTAFCSEECRHRQILSDERRTSLLRGGNSSSSKRAGARATETAVAA